MSAMPIPAADARSECITVPCSSRFSVAGITVEVLGDDPHSVHLGPQLQAFASQDGQPDIEVRINSTPRLEPSHGKELFHSGAIWSSQRTSCTLISSPAILDRALTSAWSRMRTLDMRK
jgi:hypothetical protein